ncbi:MAG: DUF3781 domain-containing protein [Methanomassiliicoccaceae archaeon]|nr:DUF3781 domain-containing protein [Methanomassiliicoccaceae archaeon]
MCEDLLANLDKIHSTERGILRIRRNLELNVPDEVAWCRQRIPAADTIIRGGKNWYVHADGVIITVNAGSFTIITAHKKDR